MAKGRIVIAMLGMDQHELGAIAVARILRDAGMEVVYAGRFQTPHSIVQTAIDEDADVIGISCHSWEYVDYIPEMMKLIADKGADVSVVIGGSIITPADETQMKAEGVAAIFGSGAGSEMISGTIANLVSARQHRIAAA